MGSADGTFQLLAAPVCTVIFNVPRNRPSRDVATTLDTKVRIDRVGIDALPIIRRLNTDVFQETRVINRFDRRDLLILLAQAGDEPIGFKIGYGENRTTFYSAKGCVLEQWRRRGIARQMLDEMIDHARRMGYQRFAYDTFPNMHPGMTLIGIHEGFRITAAGYNSTYKDYRLRFEKDI